MKCITCNQEIPDASTTCPYCNNKVTPAVSASQALGFEQVSTPTNDVLPQTPQDYKLPKDQLTMTQQMNVVNSQPVNNVVEQNIPKPPVPPTMEQTNVAPPPQMNQSYFDPTKINLDNVDLNANANATTLDYTQTNASDRLGTTIMPNTKKKVNTGKIKKVFVLLIILIIIALAGAGGYFYYTQYRTTEKRIDKVVDGMFSQVVNISNSQYETGSGKYTLDYSSEKNDDKFLIKADGKYAYDFPNKKVDLITNFKNIYHNQELLDNELNVELYLESNRAYFLLQNFKDDYVYTDIDKSYDVIKNIESRFVNPEELMLFSTINNLYDNGLANFSNDYFKFVTNISQNEVKYQNITRGIKEATKDALKAGNPTQKFDGKNNVITINLSNSDTLKQMILTFVSSLRNNKQAWNELVTIYGDEKVLNNEFSLITDRNYQGIKGDLTIVTDPFKNSLKYISIPSLKDDKICTTTISPIGNGYKIVSKLDGREIVNISYTRTTSKASTTETKTFKLVGTIYNNGVADNLNVALELVKDINPEKINVITRNSIDYSYLTPNDYAEIASKIESFGNLGVLFKSHYAGYIEQLPTNPEEQGETPVDENTIQEGE